MACRRGVYLMAATMLSTDAGIMQSLMRTLVQKGVPKSAIVNAVGKMKKLPPWMDPDMQDRMLTTRDDSVMRKLNVAWRVQNAFGNRMFNKFPLRPPTKRDIHYPIPLPARKYLGINPSPSRLAARA